MILLNILRHLTCLQNVDISILLPISVVPQGVTLITTSKRHRKNNRSLTTPNEQDSYWDHIPIYCHLMATTYCENITQHIIIKGFILWILVLSTGKTQCWSDYHCPHFTAKVICSRWHTHSVAEQADWPESTLSPFSAPPVTVRVKSTLLPKTFTHSSSIFCVIRYNSR